MTGVHVPHTTERCLKLLALLQTGRQWRAQDLADRLEIPTRTLRRDIDLLRSIGYSVHGVRGPGGHYQLAAGATLPPLMFDDDEAIAVMLGLSLLANGDAGVAVEPETADRASRKIRRVLPRELREAVDDLLAVINLEQSRSDEVGLAQIHELANAITSRRRITFHYSGRRGDATLRVRTVESLRLARAAGHWYLRGWDADRGDWRTFRVSRMDEIVITEQLCGHAALSQGELPSDLRQWLFGRKRKRAVIIIHADLAESSHLHRIDGTLTAIDENRTRYEAYADSYEWLLLFLAASDFDFTVVEPIEFAEMVTKSGQRLVCGGSAQISTS